MIRTLTVIKHVARCNGCGDQTRDLPSGFIDEETAVAEAIAFGWLITSEGHFCPACRLVEPS